MWLLHFLPRSSGGDCVSLGLSSYSAHLRASLVNSFQYLHCLDLSVWIVLNVNAEAALTLLQFVGAGHVGTSGIRFISFHLISFHPY